jgi:hypothetical protein
MAIDDPREAFEQQYMRDEENLPQGLAILAGKVGGKLAFPDGGLALEILEKVADALFNDVTAKERVKAMWDLFAIEISHLEATKTSQEDVQRAIQLAFVYDRQQRDDKKRERYVKLIGNSLRSEEQIQDVMSFVQMIEQLNERDVTVLKVLNKIMNKEGDWKAQHDPVAARLGSCIRAPSSAVRRSLRYRSRWRSGKRRKRTPTTAKSVTQSATGFRDSAWHTNWSNHVSFHWRTTASGSQFRVYGC